MIGRTYADVKLDCAPENQHGGVSSFGNGDDLYHAHDRANCGKHSEEEDDEECCLSPRIDLQLQQKWNGKEENDQVEKNGYGGKNVESDVVPQTASRRLWEPTLLHRSALEE